MRYGKCHASLYPEMLLLAFLISELALTGNAAKGVSCVGVIDEQAPCRQA
ncbi:hypothetical protein ACLB1N_02280 [Escherichia coli]